VIASLKHKEEAQYGIGGAYGRLPEKSSGLASRRENFSSGKCDFIAISIAY
jgi:hypothetical protein